MAVSCALPSRNVQGQVQGSTKRAATQPTLEVAGLSWTVVPAVGDTASVWIVLPAHLQCALSILHIECICTTYLLWYSPRRADMSDPQLPQGLAVDSECDSEDDEKHQVRA